MDKLCECGCGLIAPIYNQTSTARGIIKGQSAKFIHGHNRTVKSKGQLSDQLCECGCGQFTIYSKYTKSVGDKQRKGRPLRFISGHNTTRGDFEKREDGLYKRCSQCKLIKLLISDNYYFDKTHPKGKSICRLCEKDRRWTRHNISPQQAQLLYEQQNKCCSICKRYYKLDNLKLDHNHNCCSGDYSCGKCIRGLLCCNHNLMLGYAEDNISILEQAIKYLEVTT